MAGPALTRALALLLGLAALLPAGAQAFPHFARKYETGCGTCHLALPKLNTFGQAFRDNGYEWPGGEREMTKDPPVVISAEANKEAFPHATWPAWIPRSLPLSALAEMEVALSPRTPAWISAEGLRPEAELMVGGAITRGIAARLDLVAAVDVAGKSASLAIEQGFLQFRLYKRYLDLKVGAIYPEIFSFTPQVLGGHYWVWEDRPLGDTGFQHAGRLGVELRSVLAGRVRLVAGTAGSEGDLGGHWDAWGRVGVKIGGMRLDGIDLRQTQASAEASRPWRDNSLSLSAFGYYGQTRYAPAPPAGAPPDVAPPPLQDPFFHVGGDVSAWIWDANVTIAYVLGRHQQLYADATAPTLVHLGLFQIDYVVFPWLVPSARFEIDTDMLNRPYDPDRLLWRILPGVSVLVRDQVRAYAYCEAGPGEDRPIAFSRLLLGLMAAM